MVSEKAVDEFWRGLHTLNLYGAEMHGQHSLLDTVLGIKEEAAPGSAKVFKLLGTITGALMRLTIKITKAREKNSEASEQELPRCRDEIRDANQVILGGVIEREGSNWQLVKNFWTGYPAWEIWRE